MSDQNQVMIGHSTAIDPKEAVREFHAAVSGPNKSLVIFFCSSHYNLDIITSEINTLFPSVPIIGCTTAGEISAAGYKQHSFSGVSFSSDGFLAVANHIDLQNFDSDQGHNLVNDLLQKIEEKNPNINHKKTFGFMLIDGLSKKEEQTVSVFQKSLGTIKLFGGSAGDDQKLKQTWVFCNGAFYTNQAVLVLINTRYKFKIFKTQHFIGGDERLIVTKADIKNRKVIEINGLPAAEEYARVLNINVNQLGNEQFSISPMVVRINGADYVRSIQTINEDKSLTFYCAIDQGIILRVAHGIDFIKNLSDVFADINTEIGRPQLTLVCDCIFRNLEMTRKDLKKQVEEIFKKNNAVGFSTYGEQYLGIHINQTITGMAIGENEDIS